MPVNPTSRFTYSRNGAGSSDERCLIRVNIPGVTTDSQHTRYKIEVTNVQTRQVWHTSHRYSEFLALRNELLAYFSKAERKCPGCVNYEKVIQLFEFPSKRYFTSKNPVVLNYRKTALRSFLLLLASHTFTSSPKCPTCSALPFTAVRDFLTEQLEVASETNSATGSNADRESIRESIQVKDFTTYVAPTGVKSVNSEGNFIRRDGAGTAKGGAKGKKTPAPKNKQPTKPATPKAADLPPSPASSSAGSTSSSSVPPSPAAVEKPTTDATSFVSFSGPSPSDDAKPQQTEPAPSPRQAADGSPRNLTKESSSHTTLQSQPSAKESMDDEFGSLNMDFLQNVSIGKK